MDMYPPVKIPRVKEDEIVSKILDVVK
jgi:hypothetical protein